LEECDDYDCAFEMLKNTPISSPCYLIVGGTKGNEGAIITRDRFGPSNVELLTDANWYIIQTN
jgi:hypothetical protein